MKKTMVSNQRLRQIILEELTRDDKTEIRDMISKEIKTTLKSRDTKDIIEKEIEKVIGNKATKDQMGDIAKKVLKKLYKDLSLQHPYIIDRIKV
jgi:hypothetical protein